jgi:hypothetical protein
VFRYLSGLWILKQRFSEWNTLQSSGAATPLTVGWNTEEILNPRPENVWQSHKAVINLKKPYKITRTNYINVNI